MQFNPVVLKHQPNDDVETTQGIGNHRKALTETVMLNPISVSLRLIWPGLPAPFMPM